MTVSKEPVILDYGLDLLEWVTSITVAFNFLRMPFGPSNLSTTAFSVLESSALNMSSRITISLRAYIALARA